MDDFVCQCEECSCDLTVNDDIYCIPTVGGKELYYCEDCIWDFRKDGYEVKKEIDYENEGGWET